jgi:uncharacterized membrane protein YccC
LPHPPPLSLPAIATITSRGALARRSLREAIATMLAILLAFACVCAIDPEPGPLVLAVVLSLSLWRSQLDRNWRGRVEAAAVLPLVGLACLGVGLLLRQQPAAGAVLFAAGIAASIWLRRFGPAASRAGSLIALPFVALLVTPNIPSHRLSPSAALLMPLLVGFIALASVTAIHWLGRRLKLLPPAGLQPEQAAIASAGGDAAPRLLASTRMAIQMAVALALAFAVGFGLFPGHWSWVVLTAFIVNSGNRGRGDVAYKSILRVLGAAAGTFGALLLTAHLAAPGAATVGLILLALFFGIWLRPLGYAWWALFVTLVLAMLQSFTGAEAGIILWPRLEQIVIGAVIGVASAWLVLPVRSTGVLRLRIAQALAALSTALDPATPERSSAAFVAAMARVEEVAPAFRAQRLLTRRFRALQPADWVDALGACVAPAVAAIDGGKAVPGLRAEVGKARRAMREPAEVLPALQALKAILEPRL